MTETLWPGGPSVHPAAAVFPLMEGAEFEEFVADIKTNGLQQPIWLMPDGSVLDGRNRWLACRKANVEPRFDTYDGDTPIQFVVSLNLKRRHLDEGQRAWVAQKIANLPRGGDRKSDQTANLQFDPVPVSDAAKLLNVSERSVYNARIVAREGAENVQKAVEQGQVAPSAAAKAVKVVNEKEGSVEAGKKVQASWSPEDIKVNIKELAAEKVVETAQRKEAEGKGNAVTNFMIRERRVPGPKEAHKLAMELGHGVADSTGTIQPPVPLEMIEARRDLDRIWAGLSDAVDVLDGADAALLKDSIPTCFRPEILQRIPACRDALLNLENLLKQGSADVASSQHVA